MASAGGLVGLMIGLSVLAVESCGLIAWPLRFVATGRAGDQRP